jgi:hypothetical protein
MRVAGIAVRARMGDRIVVLVGLAFAAWALYTSLLASQFSPWDFAAFWGAGKALNLGLDPYLASTRLRLGVPAGFFSPIFLAMIFQPIAALFPVLMRAKLVWTACNILGGAALSLILVRLSGLRVKLRSYLVATALLVAFEPFTGTMQLGQTDILVVLAVAASWLLLEHRRDFLAGVTFCCGASNPHLILGIGVYYLYRAIVRRQYRLLLGLLVGGIPVVVTSVLYLGYTIEWITRVLPLEQVNGALDPNHITIIHLAMVYAPRFGIPGAYALRAGEVITTLVTLLALGACVCIWHRGKGRSTAVEMGATVVLTVVAATFAYHQDLLLLVLIGPSLVAVWRDTSSIAKVGYLAVCASTFLFSSLTGLIAYGQYEFRLPFYAIAPFVAGVLLLTQLRPSRSAVPRVIPWAVALAGLSVAGDLLPTLVGIHVTQIEITLILLGLLAYLLAIWRWYGGAASVSDERQAEHRENLWRAAPVARAAVPRTV